MATQNNLSAGMGGGPAGMTVAVTGATGFVGRHVVRELLQRGMNVRALVRSREKARDVLPRDPRLELVVGDALDSAAAAELMKTDGGRGGVDAVVHLIGIIREARGGVTFERMHVGTTRTLLAAAQAAGVRRWVQMSALGVREDGCCAYQRTKWEAEQLVRRSGLDWTIFRPGMIHGPGSEFLEMAEGWVSGQTAPWLFIPYFTRGVEDTSVPLGGVRQVDPVIAPVYVEDVAAAFGRALQTDDAIGEIYNLAGPEVMSWPEFLTTLRDGMGGHERMQPWGIPAGVAALKAKAAAVVGLGGLMPFDEGMALMGAEDSVAETTKVAEQLGVRLRPFRGAFAGYAAEL